VPPVTSQVFFGLDIDGNPKFHRCLGELLGAMEIMFNVFFWSLNHVQFTFFFFGVCVFDLSKKNTIASQFLVASEITLLAGEKVPITKTVSDQIRSNHLKLQCFC
jgi:hypothetical protein